MRRETVETFRLLSRPRIELWAFEGDGKRFSRLFKEVWRQIPGGGKKLVLSYWRDPPVNVCPRLELVEIWSEWSTGTAAFAYLPTGIVVFHAATFGLLPDDVAKTVIAHELSHIASWSYWKKKGLLGTAYSEDPDTLQKEIETDAAHYMSEWGFDGNAYALWIGNPDLLPALYQAGICLCARCCERDIPESGALLLKHRGRWHPICDECAATIRAELAAGKLAPDEYEIWTGQDYLRHTHSGSYDLTQAAAALLRSKGHPPSKE
jgi:hypothetical protein